jgi:hypothetical protein
MPGTLPVWAPKPTPPDPMVDVVFHEDDEDEEDEGPGVITFHPAPLVVENRHNLPKKAGDTLLTGASLGISAAQFGTGSLGTAKTVAALVGGAAVGATPIGLAAAAGVATVVSSTLSVVSAVKTASHIQGLQKLYESRESFKGNCAEILSDGVESSTDYAREVHDIVANQVLPYIITKKEKKLVKKIVSSVPGGGLLTGAYGVVKKVVKFKLMKTLGVNRTNGAKWLASHFLNCNCKLTNGIIADLFSEKEMQAFASFQFEELWKKLSPKLKSK